MTRQPNQPLPESILACDSRPHPSPHYVGGGVGAMVHSEQTFGGFFLSILSDPPVFLPSRRHHQLALVVPLVLIFPERLKGVRQFFRNCYGVNNEDQSTRHLMKTCLAVAVETSRSETSTCVRQTYNILLN